MPSITINLPFCFFGEDVFLKEDNFFKIDIMIFQNLKVFRRYFRFYIVILI
jgi:hypothetical protein